MQIKEARPVNFLFYRTETTIAQLFTLLPIGQKLYKEAVEQGLSITGPVHWHYFNFTGDVNQRFILEICLPVAEVVKEYDGLFHFKRTDLYKCVSIVHEGDWQDIPKSYEKLMQFMDENKLTPVAINRELYINVDFNHPENNVTEIQMGIMNQ